MITATARKTSLEIKQLRNCDYFAIILSCSHFTMLAKNPTTGRFMVVILSCCFVEDGRDCFMSACRTCSTIIFPHSTNQILNLCVVVAVSVVDAKTPFFFSSDAGALLLL